MAYDNKYGKVTTEFPGPEEDEPVVVFRAQDRILPNVMRFYYEECERNGSPPHHLALIEQTTQDIEAWQQDHKEQVRVPNSDRYMARVGVEEGDGLV